MTLPEAQARAALRASNRGCAPDCDCPECISDEIDVAAARWGLNVEAIIAAGNEAKAATSARPSRRGSGNGSGAGKPRRRKVPAPSDKQLAFLTKLFDEREFDSPLAAQVLAEETYSDDFGGRDASRLIDLLMKLPRRGAAEREAQQQRARQELEVGRLYKFAGEIYRVQMGRGLYALRLLPSGKTEYAPGVVTQLDPAQKLTLEEAKAWGRETTVCCECGALLTDPRSVAEGIGPICAGRYA